MSVYERKRIFRFWIPFYLSVLVFFYFSVPGFSYSGEAVLAWNVWSDVHNDTWKIILATEGLLFVFAPFHRYGVCVVENLVLMTLFAVITKLMFFVRCQMLNIENSEYYFQAEYSLIFVVSLLSILFLTVGDKKKTIWRLLSLFILSLLVSFQIA
jgi:hypothetical protein